MAKLADVKGRSQNKLYEGAYYRCFGDIQLSRLLSRVQSLIIKNGHELERMVAEYGGEYRILVDNLDRLLLEEEVKKEPYLVEKKGDIGNQTPWNLEGLHLIYLGTAVGTPSKNAM